MSTWPSSKSAARSATSSRCRSLKPSARCARNWAARTRCSSTSRWCPYIAAAGELKTKPTQHSVKELLSIGIQPDILLCRTDRFLSKDIKSKIALFCNVENEAVITAKDVASIYEVPLVFAHEQVDRLALRYLRIDDQGA